MTDDLHDRILGSLCLAGMGDALGAPTEHWTIDEIRCRHGGLVTQFIAPPPDTVAGALGGRRAEVSDDASQLYHVARALVRSGGVLDRQTWTSCLLDWADTSPKAVFMGPSTRAAVAALRAGRDGDSVGAAVRTPVLGNTNGAAMRVAPCGLVHPGDVRAACELALVTCLPSHDTDVAIGGACAVAAGVAAALVTDRIGDVVAACVDGARRGEALGVARARRVPGARIGARIEMALQVARSARDDDDFMRRTEAQVGTSVLAAESVAAAIGLLAYAGGDPLRTISLGASMGNDTDTMATIAGALCGALVGSAALPQALLAEFVAVNEPVYGIRALTHGLAALAGARSG